jgi:hypothetical protein
VVSCYLFTGDKGKIATRHSDRDNNSVCKLIAYRFTTSTKIEETEMKKLCQTFALTLLAMILPVSAALAGPVIIDGTDSNDHGSSNGTANINGWLYMQKVLENLANNVGNVNKTVTILGTDPGTTADDAINSAFSLSNIASTWNSFHINGATDIANFLDGQTVGGINLANTGILYIPTAGNTFGDLAEDELAEINSRGTAIANFVNGPGTFNQGGGLFAMAESPTMGQTPYGWLRSVIPTISSVADQGETGVSTALTLTQEGSNAFPGLSGADLSSGPWHNYFTGNFGSLKVLATAPDDNGQIRNLILGGGAGTVINPTPIPEPGLVVGLLAFGAFGAVSLMKRQQQQKEMEQHG